MEDAVLERKIGHARAAQRAIEQRLHEQGCRMTMQQAIDAGVISDIDWCEELERQRQIFGISSQEPWQANPV